MARLAPRVPELTDVLCESCGYVLNGLPESGRCPECGKPIAESAGTDRNAPDWETRRNKLSGFFRTTYNLIVHPTAFYRHFAVRGPLDRARNFARLHWIIAGVLFGVALATHTLWYITLLRAEPWLDNPLSFIYCAGLIGATYFSLDGITRLAARLTTWEATYRGIRLPYPIVLRGIYYHAAHYLPVAFFAALTIVGYQILLRTEVLSPLTSDRYLYLLCAQVVLSAIYLFQTYWIGMRNMMYANR